MHKLKLIRKAVRTQQPLSEARPHVCQDGDSVSLQFQIGEIQSEMHASDPISLVLPYTRTMMAFQLFHPDPRRIIMIGLGGGSIVKWCHHHLPATRLTVVEINPRVISLREQFLIPPDDERLHVIQGDGADYIATAKYSPKAMLPEVLLVDGFDNHGQPPQLSSDEFYENCYRTLASDGVLVANLCDQEDRQSVDRIRKAFNDRVLIVVPRDGENKIAFAVKGKRSWVEETPPGELATKFLADYVLIPASLSPQNPNAS